MIIFVVAVNGMLNNFAALNPTRHDNCLFHLKQQFSTLDWRSKQLKFLVNSSSRYYSTFTCFSFLFRKIC